MYKTERIASGNGSERLAISWHTLLIGQNLPQSLTLGSAQHQPGTGLVPKSCLKDGGVPKSPCSCNWQPWCPSAGTPSNINCAYPPVARAPSIEEEHQVQVLVRDNNVDQALKVLKKKMQREGVFREMKLRGHYEKPSERRIREKAEAIRRARKLARKKLQREGLLPMKPRAIPDTLGRAGPPRAPRF
jgi:small subunit ribosomal protein S21